MKFIVKRWRVLLGVVFLLMSAGTFAVVAPAYAQFYDECPTGQPYLGRETCYGYFTGTYRQAPSGKDSVVFYNGLQANNADELISLITNYLNDQNSLQNRVGAATIVDVMLGKKGPDFNGSRQQGIDYAKANLNSWAKLVRQYEKRGDIEWNHTTTSNNPNGERVNHVVYDPVMNDTFNKSTPFYTTKVIRFNVPKGQTGEPFQVERDCGNLFGYAGALQGTPATGDINPTEPPSNGKPPGYGSASNSAINSSCQVISGHAFDTNTPSYPVKVNLTYSISGGPTVNDQAVASTSAPYLYNRTTPAAVQASVKPVTVTAVGLDSGGNPTIPISGSPLTLGPCLLPAPICDGYTINPTDIDPDTPYSITAKVNYNNAAVRANVLAQPDTKFFITIQGPGVNTTAKSANVGQIQQYGVGGLQFQTSQPKTNQTGSYAIGWGITGSYGAVNCGSAVVSNPSPPTFLVTKKPYFSVDGGDLSAGAGMSTGGVDCSASGGLQANPNAGIVSWNRGTGGAYAGAGTKYAALALGYLQDFATGQGSGLAPSGLAFANTGGAIDPVDIGQGIFGGQFGSTAACTADYFANATNIQSSQTLGNIVLNKGEHRTIYVDGNVIIGGNITFGPLGTGYTYADASEIPSFALVVKGNIYISPGVTQLDGFYIAQASDPTATNGIIYTCAPNGTSTGAATLTSTLQTNCNTALQVNGSFIGRQIWLLRTAGSISGAPAEQFNYSPELWLSAPFGNNLSPAAGGDYDSITSLPPVL